MRRDTANGQVVPKGALPSVPGSTVGIIANPMSGRDIRRLVAKASVFPNAEKTNMVLRLIAACGATSSRGRAWCNAVLPPAPPTHRPARP